MRSPDIEKKGVHLGNVSYVAFGVAIPGPPERKMLHLCELPGSSTEVNRNVMLVLVMAGQGHKVPAISPLGLPFGEMSGCEVTDEINQ